MQSLQSSVCMVCVSTWTHSIFRTIEARVRFSRKPLKKISKSSIRAAGSDFCSASSGECLNEHWHSYAGGRAGVRYVITKFYRMDSLPNFLTHGAPLARFARESSAMSMGLCPSPAKRKWAWLYFWLIQTSYIALQFKEQRSQSH